ncbi:putative Ig domain-containing protein [Cryomorphaceae bacterium 1068]|nr:putative Ig domain-containing protein [Cryomorphaceae bacterium 1068]
MKNTLFTAVLFLLSFSLFSQTTLYVSPTGTGDGLSPDDPIELQFGLSTAYNSGGDYELRVLQGNYSGFTLYIDFDDNSGFENITVSGGWLAGYVTQEADPSLTILDGEEVRQVIDITPGSQTLSGDLEFSNLTIANGYSNDKSGGGILVESGEGEVSALITLVFDRVHFLNNVADDIYSGGAISTGLGFRINDCLFDGNSGSSGGAIHSYSSENTLAMDRLITNTTFENNSNYGNQGSSIYTSSSTLTIEDCEFYGMTDGTDSGNGSGIYSAHGHLIVDRCKFEGIRINYWASAIQGWNSNVDIYNSLFLDNKAGIMNGYGTVAYYHANGVDDQLMRIVNSTFAGNEAQGAGNFASAVHFRGNGNDQIDIHNSIFWDNGATAVYRESGIANIGWCISENDALGFTNEGSVINDDPLFEDGHRLATNSPAIDAGNNSYLDPEWTDLDGGIRLLGMAADFGAFEFNEPPSDIWVGITQIEENNIAGMSFTTLEAEGQTGDEHVFTLATGDGSNDADNDKFSIVDDLLALDESANFEEQNTYFIYLKATDTDEQEVEVPVQILVLDVNEAPFIVGNLMDQDGLVGEFSSFTVDLGIFNDEDEGDALTFSSTLANSDDLPAWLSFDPETGSFEGTPIQTELLEIKIIATDMMGLQAEDTFILNVMPLGLYDRDYLDLNIYPNPTRDYVYFDGEIGQGRYTIYNLEGKAMESGVLTVNSTRIDVRALKSGIYILVLSGEDWYSSYRFIFE